MVCGSLNVVLCILLVPSSLLIGVATATIGFTAWTILLPLLWTGFDLPLYDVIFLSLFVDCLNGFFLSSLYARRNKIDIKTGGIYGFIASLGGVLGIYFMPKFFKIFGVFLKKGGGYLSFFFCIIFALRAWKSFRAPLPITKEEDLHSKIENERTDESSSHIPHLSSPTISKIGISNLNSSSPFAQRDSEESAELPTVPRAHVSLDLQELVSSVGQYTKKPKNLDFFLAGLICWFVGLGCGMMGFSGGIIFVFVMIYLLKEDDLVRSLATSGFMMTLLTLFVLLLMLAGGFGEDSIELQLTSRIIITSSYYGSPQAIFIYLIILILCNPIGVVVITKVIATLVPWKLNALVCGVMLIVAVFATVQSFLLPSDSVLPLT